MMANWGYRLFYKYIDMYDYNQMDLIEAAMNKMAGEEWELLIEAKLNELAREGWEFFKVVKLRDSGTPTGVVHYLKRESRFTRDTGHIPG